MEIILYDSCKILKKITIFNFAVQLFFDKEGFLEQLWVALESGYTI